MGDVARGTVLLCLVWALGASPTRAHASKTISHDKAISQAVQRGVTWLRKKQKGNGTFGPTAGETALALLALRHSGVLADDPACLKAARQLRRALPDGTVYGAGLGILALLEQPRQTNRKLIEKLREGLVAGQCRNGQWSYAYRRSARKKAGDNSNTQVAVLALAALRKRGLAVPDAPFALARKYFVAHQNEDGGYGYAHNQRSRSYGSMTASAAMALALCGETGAPLQRAVAWIGKDFDPQWNRNAARAFGKKKGKRNDSFWRHYWLWSLERAGSAASVSVFGGHNWYDSGAAYLLKRQRKDGAWRDPERDLLATSFALLFFARSTRLALTPRRGEVVVTKSG